MPFHRCASLVTMKYRRSSADLPHLTFNRRQITDDLRGASMTTPDSSRPTEDQVLGAQADAVDRGLNITVDRKSVV